MSMKRFVVDAAAEAGGMMAGEHVVASFHS
jgi:hypothetical protein